MGMDKKEFWRLVDSTHKDSAGDQDLQEAMLISRLEKYTPEEIIEFECIMREYLIEADDFTVMAAQKIIEGWVTDDPYLYFRCWLIGQGESTFTETLRNPDVLADLVEDDVGYLDFEPLLYVATQAYEQRTGQQEDDDDNNNFPRNAASERGLSYDFGSITKGEDWTEEQLPTLLPRLWAKFNT